MNDMNEETTEPYLVSAVRKITRLIKNRAKNPGRNSEQLGLVIWSYATGVTSSIEDYIKSKHKKSTQYATKLFACNLAFLCLAVDNQLYSKYGINLRDKLMDEAHEQIKELINKLGPEGNKMEVNFVKYEHLLSAYARMLYPNGDNPSGTLVWEYCTTLVQDFDINTEGCMVLYASSVQTIAGILEVADI